jgi:hypothetical protein
MRARHDDGVLHGTRLRCGCGQRERRDAGGERAAEAERTVVRRHKASEGFGEWERPGSCPSPAEPRLKAVKQRLSRRVHPG